MSALTTSETLNLAADLIEERGWVQKAGWPLASEQNRALCLEGAIMAAVGIAATQPDCSDLEEGLYGPLATCPAYQAVFRYLGEDDLPWSWNDYRDRTQAEVVAVLRATAVIESAREVRTTLTGLPGSPA